MREEQSDEQTLPAPESFSRPSFRQPRGELSALSLRPQRQQPEQPQ
jgi:hypothetical protein